MKTWPGRTIRGTHSSNQFWGPTMEYQAIFNRIHQGVLDVLACEEQIALNASFTPDDGMARMNAATTLSVSARTIRIQKQRSPSTHVGESVEVAPCVLRNDWSKTIDVLMDANVTEEERSVLAKFFAQQAASAYASIATFTQTSMVLLQVAAPPWLLRAYQLAVLDKIEHARLAYSLASSWFGATLGPGAIADTGGLSARQSVQDVSMLLIHDGIQHMFSAIEATFAEQCSFDPYAQEYHGRVAHDALAHSEMSWKSVAWLLSHRHSQDVHSVLLSMHAAVKRTYDGWLPLKREEQRNSLAYFGFILPNDREKLHRNIATQIVLPLLDSLIERTEPMKCASKLEREKLAS